MVVLVSGPTRNRLAYDLPTPLVLANQGNPSPSLFEPHNLNHVSVFLITLSSSVLLALGPWTSLYLRTVAIATLLHGCWLINIHTWLRLRGYQHTWFCLSFFHSTVAPIIWFCSKVVFSLKFFFSPPWVLSPTFHYQVPVSPSWLPSASLLFCLLVVVVHSLCLTELPVSVCWLWVELKGWVCLPSTPCEGTKVSKAPYTRRECTQGARRPLGA